MAIALWQGLQGQDAVNPHAQAIIHFEERVDAYVAIHRAAEGELHALKTTNSPADISGHQHSLAEKIRFRRGNAGQGDIFSPEISQELRRLARIPLQGVNSGRIHKSLKSAEPVRALVRANTPYPQSVPLQSIPPSLLEHLPKVPPEVDYRIVGHTLILRDVAANLIVDYIPNAIP